MNRRFRYEPLGLLQVEGQGVKLDPPPAKDPQGIVAFVEHGTQHAGRLGVAGGTIRYVKHGWLSTVLGRPHPMARKAIMEGAEVGVFIHVWDDPMAAAATAQDLVDTDQPAWNMGIRR